METASKDVLFKIALDSELPALLNWCVSSKKFKEKVCNNDDVWRAKLLKDYPEYKELDLSFLSPSSLFPLSREKYVFMYQLDYIKKLLNTKKSLKDIFLKKELELSNKNLARIPSLNLPNLEELYVEYNQLTEVPNFNLPSLHFLNLNNNKLREIPKFNFPSLQNLSLDNNQLTKVPNFNLPSLEVLYLDNNQLTEVPIFNLPSLLELHLENNRLTETSKEEIKKRYGNKVKV